MTILNVQRWAYPSQHNAIVTTDVLTVGSTGDDYAVYRGHGSPTWVAINGRKLTHAEAVLSFPNLPKDKYRS